MAGSEVNRRDVDVLIAWYQYGWICKRKGKPLNHTILLSSLYVVLAQGSDSINILVVLKPLQAVPQVLVLVGGARKCLASNNESMILDMDYRKDKYMETTGYAMICIEIYSFNGTAFRH